MKSLVSLFAQFAFVYTWAATTPQIISIDKEKSAVEFEAIGKPSMLTIHGKGTAIDGSGQLTTNSLQGHFVFDLQSLDTGLKMRNKHMQKKYLQTDQEPFRRSELQLTECQIPNNVSKGDGEAKDVVFKGKLKLHGEEKEIAGKLAELSRKGDLISARADFMVKMSDFHITKPYFAGISVDDDVKVHVNIAAHIKR